MPVHVHPSPGNGTYAPLTHSTDVLPAGTLVNRHPSEKVIIGVDGDNGRYFSLNWYTLWEGPTSAPGLQGTQIGRGVPLPDCDPLTMGNAKIVRFGGTYYLSALDTTGLGGVWKVTDPDVVDWWGWTRVHTGTAGTTVMPAAFNTDGTYLYWGEYGSPSGGPRIWRTTDGSTWSVVLGPIADGTNHVHAVNPDPYNAGHVYAAFGDASALKHMRSTDNGATWTEIAGSGNSTWQAVQISFTEDHVYYAADSNTGGWTAFRLDRATDTLEHLSHDWHFTVAVPGGRGGRFIDDLTFNAGSTTMTSATAAFTSADVGAVIRADHGAVQDNTIIRSITNATTIVVSTAPIGDNGTTDAIITGDQFYGACLFGAVDPATAIFYCVAADPSSVGNTPGLFAITPDGRLHLLKVLQSRHDTDVFIADGYVWWGGYTWPLLSA